MELAQRLLGGDRRALARAITLTENGDPQAVELAAAVFPHTGRARTIGVTGPPGAGKSTLVDGLAHAYRRSGQRVAVLAIDPTSPFSGGAILGDRIRMRRVTDDPGVFMRSLATRGHLGGLSWHTGSVVRLLDAAGFEVVIIETVGAGQAEVEIMRYAATTIVVMVPGLGDEVQAIKAGILEVADVLAVNKADRDGADALARELENMLRLGDPRAGRRSLAGSGPVDRWVPPVVKTVATTDAGIENLVQAADDHYRQLETGGGLDQWRGRELASEVRGLVRELAGQRAQVWAETTGAWERRFADVAARRVAPHHMAQGLVDEFLTRL